jgi:hypothetical protein
VRRRDRRPEQLRNEERFERALTPQSATSLWSQTMAK